MAGRSHWGQGQVLNQGFDKFYDLDKYSMLRWIILKIGLIDFRIICFCKHVKSGLVYRLMDLMVKLVQPLKEGKRL